jgi:hypothetical protein
MHLDPRPANQQDGEQDGDDRQHRRDRVLAVRLRTAGKIVGAAGVAHIRLDYG